MQSVEDKDDTSPITKLMHSWNFTFILILHQGCVIYLKCTWAYASSKTLLCICPLYMSSGFQPLFPSLLHAFLIAQLASYSVLTWYLVNVSVLGCVGFTGGIGCVHVSLHSIQYLYNHVSLKHGHFCWQEGEGYVLAI